MRTLSWLLISMLLNRGPSRSPAFDVQYRQSQQAGCRPKRTAGKVSAATSVPYVHIPPYAHNCGCMEDVDCMNCVPLRGCSLGRLELELLLGTRGKRSNGFAAVRLSLQSSEVPHLVEKKNQVVIDEAAVCEAKALEARIERPACCLQGIFASTIYRHAFVGVHMYTARIPAGGIDTTVPAELSCTCNTGTDFVRAKSKGVYTQHFQGSLVPGAAPLAGCCSHKG